MNADYSLENGEREGEEEKEDEDDDDDAEVRNIESGHLKPGNRFGFLEEHFRRLRSPRFGEAHHKRAPTPLKKKSPMSNRSSVFLSDVSLPIENCGGGLPSSPLPFSPFFLPPPRDYKGKNEAVV